MVLHYLLFLFKYFANTVGPFGLPRTLIMPSLATPVLIVRELLEWLLFCLIFDFSFCLDESAMGLPNSACLFLDLIFFVSLLS